MPVEFHVRPRSASGRSFRFVTDLERILVGRGEVCDVRLPYPPVSFHHATVQRTPRGWELTDNGSLNGTWHGGRRVHPGEAVRVVSGDRIAVPGFVLEVRITPGASSSDLTDAEAVGQAIYRALLRPDIAEETPRFEIHGGALAGRSLVLPPREAPYVIGRDPACDWEIPDREASREHLVVVSEGDRVRVIDRGSKNGVRINARLAREAVLADGDVVEVGRTQLFFRDPRGEALRLLSTEPADQSALGSAFHDLDRGDEARLTAGSSAAGAGADGSAPPTPAPPEARPATNGASAEPAPSRPPEPPRPPAPPLRDLADLLADPPLGTTVARREDRPASPDGADALIVALGVAVFLVCLVVIYVLLR